MTPAENLEEIEATAANEWWFEHLELWQFWFAVRYNLGKIDTEEQDDAEWSDAMVDPCGWIT